MSSTFLETQAMPTMVSGMMLILVAAGAVMISMASKGETVVWGVVAMAGESIWMTWIFLVHLLLLSRERM
jgi:hypothetical protein